MDHAPVVVFTYNRCKELRIVLDALADNIGASQTDVYLYSNAPVEGKEGDDEAVARVRKELENYRRRDAFRSYNLIERERNTGANDNMIPAIDEIIRKYGSVIVVEDDIVTAKSFLSFMNQALEKYKDRQEIFSICGYNPVDMPCSLPGDSFCYDAFRSWGWATWLDRWLTFDPEDETVLNRVDLEKAHSEGLMYISCIKEDIVFKRYETRFVDYRLACTEMAARKTTLYSRKSLCDNIGIDGSGATTPQDSDYTNLNFDRNDDRTDFVYSTQKLTKQSDPDYFFRFRGDAFAMKAYNAILFDRTFLLGIVYGGLSNLFAGHRSIEDYFIAKGVRRIAIYGWGDLGRMLYDLLRNTSIRVEYCIDRNRSITESRIPIYHELDGLPNTQMIVVTALSFFPRIEEDLCGRTTAELVDFGGIVAECVRRARKAEILCAAPKVNPDYTQRSAQSIRANVSGEKKARIQEAFLISAGMRRFLRRIKRINAALNKIPDNSSVIVYGVSEYLNALFAFTGLRRKNVIAVADKRQVTAYFDAAHGYREYPVVYPAKAVLDSADRIVWADFTDRDKATEILDGVAREKLVLLEGAETKLPFYAVAEQDDEDDLEEPLLPDAPYPELAERLEKINGKLRSCRGKRIGVYGVGDHTGWLLKCCDFDDSDVAEYFGRSGGTFKGRQVLQPSKEAFDRVDVIVISSYVYQEEMSRAVRDMGCGAKLVELYDADDLCEFYKIYNRYAPDLASAPTWQRYEGDEAILKAEMTMNELSRGSGRYFTFSVAPDRHIADGGWYRGEHSVWNAKNYGPANRKCAIVIQGQIIYDDDFTYRTALLYKKLFPETTVILSTWREELEKPEFQRFLDLGIELIASDLPKTKGVLNVHYQLKSTYTGLCRARELGIEYALKTRTDFRIYESSCLSYLYYVAKRFPGDNRDRARLAVLDPLIEVPYFLPDYLMFGRTEDMLRFWRFEERFEESTDGRNPEQMLYMRYLRGVGHYLENAFEDMEAYLDLLCDEFIITDPGTYRYIWKKYSYRNYLQFDNNPNTFTAADWWQRVLSEASNEL